MQEGDQKEQQFHFRSALIKCLFFPFSRMLMYYELLLLLLLLLIIIIIIITIFIIMSSMYELLCIINFLVKSMFSSI